MSSPPWEVHNATPSFIDKSLDALRFLLKPLNYSQTIIIILVVISFLLMFIGIIEIRRSYLDHSPEPNSNIEK